MEWLYHWHKSGHNSHSKYLPFQNLFLARYLWYVSWGPAMIPGSLLPLLHDVETLIHWCLKDEAEFRMSGLYRILVQLEVSARAGVILWHMKPKTSSTSMWAMWPWFYSSLDKSMGVPPFIWRQRLQSKFNIPEPDIVSLAERTLSRCLYEEVSVLVSCGYGIVNKSVLHLYFVSSSVCFFIFVSWDRLSHSLKLTMQLRLP